MSFLSFFKFDQYSTFMREKKVLSTAIAIVIGNLISNLINKIASDVITPITQADTEKIKKISIKEYIFLLLNIVLISYPLFLLSNLF